ncbi:MAG TPA: RNase adapter RapZ [Eubacterium sp.]|nr:RNase adapter RapZ [Eubacterium sp.]
MRFVIVTGISGAGKISALKIFEDSGFYCADNLPIELINSFADLVFAENSEKNKVAIGVDIRSGARLDKMDDVLKELKDKDQEYEILFLDCNNDTLVKRFKETRRSHPMGDQDSVYNEIEEEREKLAFLKEQADYIIDTSNLLIRDLRKEIENIFIKDKEYNNLFVTILSFGFKYGVPADCDLVFDVRFLPNPYYEPKLKKKTGEDKDVQDFVLNSPVSEIFIDKLFDMVDFLIPNYIDEGKNQLVIGIGCTGGHHRSVTVANELYKKLSKDDGNFGLRKAHRDIDR